MSGCGTPSRERGHALLIVTLISTLALTLWLVTWGSTGSLVRAEDYADRMAQRDGSVLRAVAAGVDLLHTGFPPTTPYSCLYVPDGDDSQTCTLTFEETNDDDTWRVEATLATTAERGSLPPAPDTFSD